MTLRRRVAAGLLSAAMVLSLTACGGKTSGGDSGSGGSGKNSGGTSAITVDTKEVTFAREDFNIDGIEGDINNISVVGDKLILYTYEWIPGKDYPEDVETFNDDMADISDEAVDEAADSSDVAEDKDAQDELSEDDAENQDEQSGSDNDIVEEDFEDFGDEDYEFDYGTTCYRVYSAPPEGGTAKLIYEPEAEDNVWIDRITKYGDNIGLVMSSWDEKTEMQTGKVLVIDTDGNLVDEKELGFVYAAGADTWVQSILFGGDGNIVGVYDDTVRVFDEAGKEKASLKVEGSWIQGAVYTNDGKLLVISDGGENTSRVVARELDVEAAKWEEEYPINVSYISSSESLTAGAGSYDFFYRTESGMFGYSLADKKETKLVDFIASDIDTSNMNGSYMVDDTIMLVSSYDFDNGGTLVEKYVKVDPSNVKEKTELTCMTVYGSSDLRQSIINFNREHDDIRINIIDYSEEDDPYSKMSADIAAGKLPDIYDIQNGIGEMSIDQCVAKNMLVDLTPLIDADPEISREDFIPSVLDAMMIDGKLYYTASGFSIVTLITKGSGVGNIDGWTFQEMRDFVNSKPDDVRLFYSSNKSDMLTEFMYGGIRDFVDWNAGTCSFDSDEFKAVLEMCNRGNNEEFEWNEDVSIMADLRDGKQLFEEGYVSTEELQMYSAIFDGDIAYVGFPNADRKGTFISLGGSTLAISTSCKNQDAAWEFVRQCMTKEYMAKNYVQAYNVPIREDAYELYIKMKSATKKYTDEYGNDIEPQQMSYGWDDLVVDIKPMTEEDQKLFRGLVDNVSGVWSYDNSLSEIITDETKAYFAGDKTVDEVASIIQNRATTYINENK